MKPGIYQSSHWDMNAAFESYREKEDGWWKSRNVKRPRAYLVRPSGHLDAPVACHLFNPTFIVDDPGIGEIDDPSNPCITQLHDVGLSSDNCLMFDHSARREDSRHCRTLYPPDLWDIHEEFLFALRYHMAAVVEICWGANVRERMLRSLQNSIRILPLWGRYKGVSLYLELNEDKSLLKRFMIFVNHPQFFMFLKGMNVRAQAFRAEQGGRQDLLLEVASCLGKIAIKPGFYKFDPLLLRPFRPTKAISEQRDARKGQAYEELKAAFPIFDFSSSIKRALGLSQKDQNELQNMKLSPIEHTSKALNLRGDDTSKDQALEDARFKQVARFWEELHDLASLFMAGGHFNLADRVECQQLITSIEASREELYHWEEIPESLATLIQAQDGLKIDQQPIISRQGAETAYRLLHCQGNPKCFSIVGLAFSVLIAYAWTIRREPRGTVHKLMVLKEPPNNIVSRSRQNYVRALKDKLENIPNPRVRGGAQWENYFLRHGHDELRELPQTVKLKCPHEECKCTLEDGNPRWTIQTVATLVLRQFTCPDCQSKGDWKPVNTNINFITSESLSRTWSRFKQKGCDLTQYPRQADVYFSQSHINVRIAQLQEAKRIAHENLNATT
ncbi:hypothetical protein N7454_000087 [Penicillium verhagenii]|nr:hypothetical protein N7454_000087 [Penicillium verhagenii]